MDFRIVLPESRPEDDKEALVKLQQDLLEWAEELFGERDTSWTLISPMFDGEIPCVFFPDPKSMKRVMIKLVCGAREKWTIALYQVAHEVIHLLNPNRPDPGLGGNANNLEEGVACAFSYHVQRMCGIEGSDFVRHNHPEYENAHRLVRRLPSGDIAAAKRIRREMPSGTPLSSVTTRDLQRIFPDLDSEHADALTRKFYRDKPAIPSPE